MDKRNLILTLICCFPLMTCYSITAIIIASYEHCANPYIGKDFKSFININLYLILGGILSILFTIFLSVAKVTLHQETDRDNPREDVRNTQTQHGLMCVVVAMEIGYSIIGCIIFNQTNADCRVSPLGKMLLAFLILTWLVNVSRIITVAIGWESTNEKYSLIGQNEQEMIEDEYQL